MPALAVFLGCAGQVSRVATKDPSRQVLLECNCELSLPADWKVYRPVPQMHVVDSICRFGLKPIVWDSLRNCSKYEMGVHAIEVSVFSGSLSDLTNLPTPVVTKDGDAWQAVGRAGQRTPAHSISSVAWEGVRGASLVGIYYNEGGYAGARDAYVALLDSRDGQLALLFASSSLEDEALFDEIVRSFKFLPEGG